VLVVPVQDADAGACLQNTYAPRGRPSRRFCGRRGGWKLRGGRAGSRSGTWCSQSVLDLLSATDEGRLVPAPAEEAVQSEASEWAPRKRGGGKVEAEELGDEGKEQPLFLPSPPPPFMAFAEKEGGGGGTVSIVLSLAFLCDFFRVHHIFLGQAWAEGKWCAPRRDPSRSHASNEWARKKTPLVIAYFVLSMGADLRFSPADAILKYYNIYPLRAWPSQITCKRRTKASPAWKGRKSWWWHKNR